MREPDEFTTKFFGVRLIQIKPNKRRNQWRILKIQTNINRTTKHSTLSLLFSFTLFILIFSPSSLEIEIRLENSINFLGRQIFEFLSNLSSWFISSFSSPSFYSLYFLSSFLLNVVRFFISFSQRILFEFCLNFSFPHWNSIHQPFRLWSRTLVDFFIIRPALWKLNRCYWIS